MGKRGLREQGEKDIFYHKETAWNQDVARRLLQKLTKKCQRGEHNLFYATLSALNEDSFTCFGLSC